MAHSTDHLSAWEETVTLPSYLVGEPNKNPMFLERRVYQGSSGVVYPHPVIDNVADEKTEREYRAIFLENRYLKIMLLPEIGGRVHMALDKTNGYHFIYYNQVIKPALVGLNGPWISGGIEFNWPQHHRPSTFQTIDSRIEAHEDGSQTVWMGEIERMFRTKGMAGFTLYPDKAYLEIKVQLYNRTTLPQTFLWWANVAVHVDENYRAVFPSDVHAVMDHGRRDVSSFPIARGTYYKVDYSPGTDISRYDTIPVPTSYMAYGSRYDFLGCYDQAKQAGMLMIADHHIAPGKKQWTWGNGDFGHAWDRQLTDTDGPYAELMSGVYTDNQPDFSWIQPGEEKRFSQVLMPYKGIGGAKNANQDAVINLDIEEQRISIGVYLSSPRSVEIQLRHRDRLVFNQQADLSPEVPFTESLVVPEALDPAQLVLRVLEKGQEIIRFAPEADRQVDVPAPASAMPLPGEILSSDELYLNGLHLEQYRHATYQPEDYYLEAIRRDPFDSRCNNAMGLLHLRRAKFAEAEAYFQAAIQRLTQRNANPYDGEAYYNLGLALTMQGRYAEATDAFHKAAWSAAWQDSAYLELARLACHEAQLEHALHLVERSLGRNGHHHAARHLKIALLRHLGQPEAAQAEVQQALSLDGMNFGAHYEQYLLTGDTSYSELMRDNVHSFIEISMDYARAGLFDAACALLKDATPTDPMAYYYLGWYQLTAGDEDSARASFSAAAQMRPDYCFPHRVECVPALHAALELNPNDTRANYYLGNFWYAHRCHIEAIACWEQAALDDPDFPTVHRNLGLAYLHKQSDPDKALAAYRRAFELNPNDARVFLEMDQLYLRLKEAPQERLLRLQQHLALVHERDDLLIEWTTLLNLLGRHQDALDVLMTHRFHPWEGGEGKATQQYVISLVELARQQLRQGDYQAALSYLEQAQVYPHNLGEGKLYNATENHIHYYLGCVYEGLDKPEAAQAHFHKATLGTSEPSLPMYYNDQPPELIFYQGLAQRKLGQEAAAQATFQHLIDYGRAHNDDVMRIDYFAVSLPEAIALDEDLETHNRTHCHFLQALGAIGLGDDTQAQQHLDAVLNLNPYHLGAQLHRTLQSGL